MNNETSPSFADIRYFLEAVSVENISRAAERLGISQPSLSAAVQRLERRLQTDLLVRRKKGVTPTREGLLFAAKARGFLAEWQTLESAVKRQKAEPSGSFTLGCHISVGLHWLPRQVPALLKQWPQLELKLVHDLSRKINDQVLNHEVDFGLVVNPARHPDLVVKELGRDVFTFWGRARRLSDTVLFDPDLRQAQTLLQRLEKRGVSFRRRVTSASLDILARLAAQGAGTAILPTHLAERTRPALRRPAMEVPTFEDVICLVYRADAQRSPGARAVIAALQAHGGRG
jgi:DNA-binding transcriptional LysR family regulator